MLDYILYSQESGYKQPKKSSLKIIPLKGDNTLSYNLFNKKQNITDLSDHYPVVVDMYF
jgi:hypothetical protein